jgi:hypothetical protein
MPKSIKELAHLKPGAHPGIGALFSKAHSHLGHIDRDLDWSLDVKKEDPCVDPSWAPFGRTPTFEGLPLDVKESVARQALGRMLNIMQLGESLAQDVCAKLVLICKEKDYRNHAAAQTMDEARHHLAFARFMEKMGDEFEEVNPITEAAFDEILGSDDEAFLITSTQFFFENVGMPLLDKLEEKATHPLLKRIVHLISRDESRHMAFGLFFVTEFLRTAPPESRRAFAHYWLSRILQVFDDPYAPHALRLMKKWLGNAGAADPERLGERMWEERGLLRAEDRPETLTGRRVHQLLSVARQTGLLAPNILEAVGLSRHPVILGALRTPLET